MGGFSYTNDQVCTCGHGVWDHYTISDHNIGRIGKCRYFKCTCKKFISMGNKNDILPCPKGQGISRN